MITVLSIRLDGEDACASLRVECPSLDTFECYVALRREAYSTGVLGEQVISYGIMADWADKPLLDAFDALQGLLGEYFAGIIEELPADGSALTSAICEAVTAAALDEGRCASWREDCRFGDGFDPCPLLVAPGSYLNHGACSVMAGGEIRDGRGYHPAASFRWEPSR